MSEAKTFEGWAVVELLGRVRVGGMVTEQTIAGVVLLRVDVPAAEHHPAFTRYYHPNALYSLCPTDEATARQVAKTNRHPPLEPWQLPVPAAQEVPRRVPYQSSDDEDPVDDFASDIEF